MFKPRLFAVTGALAWSWSVEVRAQRQRAHKRCQLCDMEERQSDRVYVERCRQKFLSGLTCFRALLPGLRGYEIVQGSGTLMHRNLDLSWYQRVPQKLPGIILKAPQLPLAWPKWCLALQKHGSTSSFALSSLGGRYHWEWPWGPRSLASQSLSPPN